MKIKINSLTHQFSNGQKGIDNIDLEIEQGEFIVIAGPNGSGKTLLMRHLAGLVSGTSGFIEIEDPRGKVSIKKLHEHIGIVFQDAEAQLLCQTVPEELAFGLHNLGISRKDAHEKAQDLMKTLDLEHCENTPPYLLSGGEKRKLAVGSILALEPDFLILDEPFSNLDYPGVQHVLEMLLKLRELGHTIIVISHDLEKVVAHSSRLIIMERGKVCLDGPPEKVLPEVAAYNIRLPHFNSVQELSWLTV